MVLDAVIERLDLACGPDLDRLEKLARLREIGALSDAEFIAEKSKLLDYKLQPANRTNLDKSRNGLSAAWQERFAFYDKYGNPSSPAARLAFRRMPFWRKRRIVFNFWGMFFGVFCFFHLGMPRRAITLLAGSVAIFIAAALLGLPEGLQCALTFGIAGYWGGAVNYPFYLKVTTGRDKWSVMPS